MEHQKFIINRFDHYYDSVNNKGNVFLGINIFTIGGLFTALTSLSTYLNETKESRICLVIMIGLSLISLIYTLISLIPYVKNKSKSLIYFGSIANIKKEIFLEKFSKQNEFEITSDLNKQIHELSIGLKNKFSYLRIAGRLFVLEALFLIPLIYFVIKNLK